MKNLIHHMEHTTGKWRISIWAPQGVAGLEFDTYEQAKKCLDESKAAFEAALEKWASMLPQPKVKKKLDKQPKQA